MKKIGFLLLALVVITATTFGQQRREFKKQPKKPGQNMMQQLNLSESQKQQAKQYREEYKKQMAELNKNENITVKEFRDRKAAIHKQQKAQFESLLTAEQKSKMSQLKAQHKAQAEAHFAKRLDKMKTQLNLTDAQVKAMKTQREAMQGRVKSIKENEALSREEKKEQLMALKSEAKEQHKKIFTAEQMKKIEEMKAKREKS